MERQFLRQVGKVGAQDFVRFLHDELAARTGGYAAQDEQVAEVVHLRVMRQRVAEINANGFKYPRWTRVTLLVQFLYELELFRRMTFRQINSRRRREPHHRLLRKILRAATAIARPFVRSGVRIVVNRSEGQ